MNKAFEKILENIENLKLPFPDECPSYYGNTNELLDATKQIVQESAEEYKNGWIACSERLPKADEDVLTCSEDGFITVSCCNNAGEFSSYADEYCIKYPKPKVVAWQPLPEPYKERD